MAHWTQNCFDINYYLVEPPMEIEIDELADKIAEKLFNKIEHAMFLNDPKQKRWLSLKEAMTISGVKSRKKMCDLIDEGFFYGYKKDRKWIVDRQSIDAAYNQERLLR